MAQEPSSHPHHLDPSELGTKEYWDKYYQNDLDNEVNESGDEAEVNEINAEPPEPSDLESWFDDVGAPAKTLAFLTAGNFPISPKHLADNKKSRDRPEVLDLGTGNGSALFSLRREGGYAGRMVGVDYSEQSIELARRLWRQYESSSLPSAASNGTDHEEITFEVLDLVHDDATSQSWWPATGFDLVLDKGTFDAISLSSSAVHDPLSNRERRICELYPSKVSKMVKLGGFLLVTSCNWTEEEVVRWFTRDDDDGGQNRGVRLEVYGNIQYPVFEFGGQKGQGVASVCFRRVDAV